MLMEYISGTFEQLQQEHELNHESAPDQGCLWCNGYLSEWWRNVNLDMEE